MRFTNPLLQASVIYCAVTNTSHVVGSTSLVTRPYSSWMADSMIALGVEPTRWYSEATFYRGIEALQNHTSSSHSSPSSPSYYAYLTNQISAILTPTGAFTTWNFSDHQLDNIRIGATILYLYTQTPSPTEKAQYKTALDFLHTRLTQHQRRTPSGGFWHKDPRYPNQMWLDGLYMAGPFRAGYAALFGAGGGAAWDDVVLQFALVEAHCRNRTSRLLKHGYDESLRAAWADPATGASPLVWIRAQGWYFMALVDVMDWFPRAHAGWERLRAWFVRLAQAVKETQDESGGWWLIMDEGYEGREGNYIESSGTAMYTYGLLKGIRQGYLDGKEFGEVAERAYRLMVERFVVPREGTEWIDWTGTVRVGSLDSNGDYEYYTSVPVVKNSVIGVGPFIMASVEMEKRSGRMG
ncbi:Glycosyl hydrolase family 88 [Madurella fahalii]|uniref:Glycosyl hydrolase family 88 n=1 Tax=Madurella fahalii TaxID=1157608 RepID=A0ABQ0GGN8_9PEZI